MTLAVTCFLWRDPARDSRGYTFKDDYVRILRNMVRRHLSIEHKFVCVSDHEIDDIQTLPIDMSKHIPGTVYARLMQHRRDYGDLIKASRVMNLDIDMVVTGSLDHLIRRTEPLVLFRNPNWPQPGRAFFQSSFQLFTPGSHPELYEAFDPNDKDLVESINWRFGGREQAWLSEVVDWYATPFVDERDGVYGAGRLNSTGLGSDLPANACLVTVPGARAPWQEGVQQQHPWIKEHWR